jgi:hypothetical protein
MKPTKEMIAAGISAYADWWETTRGGKIDRSLMVEMIVEAVDAARPETLDEALAEAADKMIDSAEAYARASHGH